MKRIFLLPIALILCNILFAQEVEHNLLQLSLQEQEQLKTLPLLKLPPQYKTKSLPIEVDNSLLPYYPGLFLQSGLSCGQVAAVSIGLTYELCRLRNLDGTDIANNYPSHFAWNWENGGQGYYGASYYHSFELMRLVGIPTTEVYGGSFDHGGSNRWMTGYDAYYNAMQNRIHKAWAIKLDTEEGILTLKNWLNDHLDGSEDGGVAFFYANYKGRDGVLPASSAHAGEGVITNWGGTSHAYTIVGYSDEVKWDFNGDGQYTNHIDINGDGIVDVRDWEIGAFKVINNYSTPYHAWAPYKTFAGDGISPSSGAWNYTANVIEAKAETNPQLTYKINLYYSKRGRIKIRTGMSTNIYANQPEHIIEFPIINNQGSDVGMLGTNEDADRYMEFGLDVSPFLNFIEPGTQAKFFFEIIETDPEQWGSGRVISFSLMDYTNGLSETICEQSDVHITNNTTTQLSIVANINYEQVNIITEELPNADIYEDYEFQLEAEGGTEPYIWELDTDYNITSSTAVMPNDITSSFSGSYIDLPFTFNFYGKPYTRIYISNQGHIDFSGSSYNTPYSHELLSSFMTFPCIAACLTSQYSFSTYLKVEDDYVAVRWTHANFIEAAVKIYKSGKIEMFYGSANIPFNAKWISGVSSGNYVNYNLFAQTNSPELQANKKFTLMPFEAPEEFHLSHSGLLTAHPTQELLQNQLHFKITDANGVIGRKILPISTQGLFINTSFQPENGEYITWGSNTKLKLNLSNAAEVPITNLVATLSSNHSQVIITKAVLDLPYLGPGHQLSIPNAFEFQTLYDFYNGEEISFNLNIVSDQGTWEFELNEKVYIPDIQYHDQFVDDNDNNRYDIGETADLVISLINNGFADLNNLECKIFTDDEYVSINSNFFTIDEIKAGQTEIGIYNLSISNIAPDGHVALINMEITGNHNYTKNIEFKISIGQFVENWETNDFTSFQWENGGNETWFITTENPYEGTYCLKSGAITHNQVSDIYLTVEILASGNISFFHKVSCEANSNALWDNLSFSIDGVEKGRWAGETDWTEASIPITTGIHTLQWRYKKDVSVSQGEDCAWIDNITFPPLFDSPPILNITPTNIVKQMPQNQVDEEYIFIKNEGGGYLHYNIQAIDTSVVENRSIAGSNVFCSTEHYEPGTTTTLVLTVNNNSNDTEWIKQVEMTFPEGFEVISSGDINCPDGVLSSNNELGDAAHIVWLGEDANGWGVLRNGKSGITSVTGIIAEDFTGDFIINYTLVGDIYGAEPHTISGNVVLTQYIPPVEWLELSNDIGILSMASEDTIALSFNTNGMEIGEYTCLLKVFVNEDTVNIPIKLIVDEDVNIEQNQFINNILVYPNPSANSFTITSNFDSENIEYEVSDITGKLIWKAKSYNNESFKWTPNEDIETGMYLLRIKNGDQTYLRKLIFNR